MSFEVLDSREAVGYLASSLVLAAFCVRDMVPLRVLAIGSNLAFMSYAWLVDLRPVLLLHLVLLPTNLVRLGQLLRERRPARPTPLPATLPLMESGGGSGRGGA